MCLLFYPPSYNAQIIHWTSSVIFLIYESPSPFSRSTLVWTLATPTELSCISLHQVTTYKERNLRDKREGNVYFPFPLPSGERWIQWFRIYGITGKHQIDDFPHISITTTLCQWLDAMATHLLSDCSSNWISQGHVCPCSGLMLIYICINIGYYLFLYKLKKRILVSFHSLCLGSIFRLCIAQPTLWLFLFLIWWSIVFLISLYHLKMENYLHFGLDLLMMGFYFRKA